MCNYISRYATVNTKQIMSVMSILNVLMFFTLYQAVSKPNNFI